MPTSTARARVNTRNRILIAISAAVAPFLYGTPVDAQFAYRSDSQPTDSLELQEGTRIEPAIAGGMSALLPGAGQFYNGQTTKGSLMLAGFAASIVFAATTGFGDKDVCVGSGPGQLCQTHPFWPNSRFWIGAGAAVGVYAWSVLDAIAVANRAATAQEADRRGADLELGPRVGVGGVGLAARVRVTL